MQNLFNDSLYNGSDDYDHLAVLEPDEENEDDIDDWDEEDEEDEDDYWANIDESSSTTTDDEDIENDESVEDDEPEVPLSQEYEDLYGGDEDSSEMI